MQITVSKVKPETTFLKGIMKTMNMYYPQVGVERENFQTGWMDISLLKMLLFSQLILQFLISIFEIGQLCHTTVSEKYCTKKLIRNYKTRRFLSACQSDRHILWPVATAKLNAASCLDFCCVSVRQSCEKTHIRLTRKILFGWWGKIYNLIHTYDISRWHKELHCHYHKHEGLSDRGKIMIKHLTRIGI